MQIRTVLENTHFLIFTCKLMNNNIALADFLEAHGLYVCNIAFQQAAHHTTMWHGQRRDATTGHIVPIYNMIDFVICRQTYKRLLTDSRSYASALLNSNHQLLITKLDLRRMFNGWGRINKSWSSKYFSTTLSCWPASPSARSSSTSRRKSCFMST